MGGKPDVNSQMSGFRNTIPAMINRKRLATAEDPTAEDPAAIGQQGPEAEDNPIRAIQFARGAALTRHAHKFATPTASSHNVRSAAKQAQTLTSVRWSALKRSARLFVRTLVRMNTVHGVRLNAWSRSVL